MTVQKRHRFNVTEYYRLVEIGALRPDARVELLDGQVYDSFPISPFHACVTRRLNHNFSTTLHEECCSVSIRRPVRLSEYTELEPDITLLKPVPDDYCNAHPGPGDVLLVIEVADASLNFDRAKLSAFGQAGIAEFWIVNLVDRTIEVYREPHFTGYGSKAILRAGDPVKPQAFPDITVDVAELLKR